MQRLGKLEEQIKPPVEPRFFVTLASGKTVTCGYEDAMSFFTQGREDVQSVITDTPGYAEIAGVIEILCRS